MGSSFYAVYPRMYWIVANSDQRLDNGIANGGIVYFIFSFLFHYYRADLIFEPLTNSYLIHIACRRTRIPMSQRYYSGT